MPLGSLHNNVAHEEMVIIRQVGECYTGEGWVSSAALHVIAVSDSPDLPYSTRCMYQIIDTQNTAYRGVQYECTVFIRGIGA